MSRVSATDSQEFYDQWCNEYDGDTLSWGSRGPYLAAETLANGLKHKQKEADVLDIGAGWCCVEFKFN